jgi:predicted enzyme related to lactoylglutathione lyase
VANGEYVHIEIPADEPARAQRFYEGLFGWEFSSMPEFPDYFMYRTPGGEHAVGGAIGKRDETAPHAVRNYVSVASLEESVARAVGLGGTLVQDRVEVPGMGSFAVLHDPEGNEIALWQTSGM